MTSAKSPKRSYLVLENMVLQGFDVLGVTLPGEVLILLKTVSPREEALMRYHGLGDKDAVTKGLYLAYATFQVEGHNVLSGDRGDTILKLERFYSSLPSLVTDMVLDGVLELQSRGYDAASLLEGFSYSSKSRTLWKTTCRAGINSEQVTGIQGTSSLGFNYVQMAWISYNEMQDAEEHDAEEMSRSIFVASATNPSGVSKAAKQMDARRRSQRELREDMVRYGSNDNRNTVLGLLGPSNDGWATKIVTNDDLIREVNKQIQGVKDKHDLFLEEFYETRRREQEDAERKRSEAAKRVHAAINPEHVFQGSAPVSDEEMRAALAGGKDIRTVVAGRAKAEFDSAGKHKGHRILRR